MSESARQDLAHVKAAPAVMSDAAAIIHVIERAALNPDVDVEKMERLYAMHEKAMERQARMAFASALAELQPKLPVIDRNGRIEVPAKDNRAGHVTPYATWEDMNDAIRPVLHEHGFAISFRIGQAQDGKITVSGVLCHREGHLEETTITLMHDSSGSKNAVQAVGSSVAYGKRYTAMALLNITSRAPQDADDDGGRAGRSEAAIEAIADINAAEGAVELGLWKRSKAEEVKKTVSQQEWTEIVALWNRRAKAAKDAANAG